MQEKNGVGNVKKIKEKLKQYKKQDIEYNQPHVDDKCDTVGKIFRTWIAVWIGTASKPDYCEGRSDSIRCAAKLVFFTITNLILAVILIVIIYIILIKKKGKWQKKRKK